MWVRRTAITLFCAGTALPAALAQALAQALPAAPAATAAPAPFNAGGPALRFKSSGRLPAAAVAGALSDEERAFVAGLPELRVGVPWPPAQPYEVVDATGQVSGIHPDMLQALASTFGLRLRPVPFASWSGLLLAARRREVDIVMTLGVTTERLDYLAFTLGATPMPGALFTKGPAPVDLNQARVAAEAGYLVNEFLRRQYPGASIVTVATTGDALRAVGDGRADAYVGSLLEATDWLGREPVPGVVLNRPLPYGTGYYHFGVRKDWAPLAAILNKGIQSLRSQQAASQTAGTGHPRPLNPGPAGAAALAAKPVWRVGAVRGLTMLNEVDERNLHSGIAAEYTEQVAQRLGVAVQVVGFASVATMLDALRSDQIDLVPFLTRTPQRAQTFKFSQPYLTLPYMLVARTDSAMFWGLDSLRGKRLALALQHPLREWLASGFPDITIVDADNGGHAMDLVLARQADAAVEVKLFANLRVNSDPGQRLRVVAEVTQLPAQFHFAASPAQAALVPLVDQALADIPAAEHERMLRRWVALDLPPVFPWRRHAPTIALALAALLGAAGLTAWWMRRLKREVASRRRSEGLLRDIASTMPGVAFRYVLNADGSMRHHFFSPSAKAFLGVDLLPGQTVLSSLRPYLSAEDHQRADDLQQQCLRSGEPYRVTCPFHAPGQAPRWLHVEAVRSLSSAGRQVWTGYIVDVSTQHTLQSQLAQEAQARHLVLAAASHELRAPTQTLALALQAMPSQGLDLDQRRSLKLAKDATHTLTELLGEVLDTARWGKEPLQLRPQRIDLRQLLDDLATAWRAAARVKQLVFHFEPAADLPRSVTLDGRRLKQVLTNLLSNACKYTPQGSVTLRAWVAEEPAPGLVFEVQDTGIGIDPAQQARVFQPFVTLDDPRAGAPAEGSTGLGLHTSLRLAQLMGGTLTLHSAAGAGTQVRLGLPLPPAPRAGEASQGSILVCDDDETSLLLLAYMLRQEGFAVLEATDATQALALWRGGGVCALISDLDLPGMSGMELMRTVRAEARQRAQPTSVIVCSGGPVPLADPAAAGADQTLPFDAYLQKPVSMPMLCDTLRQLGVAQPA